MIGDLLMARGARFSPCKTYRYELWRRWDETKPPFVFVMLNPSTATETANDPTVERCQRRALAAGAGGVVVVNLFAYRSTNPEWLYRLDKAIRLNPLSADPVGPENDEAILKVCAEPGAVVVCAWGKHGALRDRGRIVLAMIQSLGVEPLCLRQNLDGSPEHPLYIPLDAWPRPFAATPNLYRSTTPEYDIVSGRSISFRDGTVPA